MSVEIAGDNSGSCLKDLLPMLQRLDRVLERAVAAAPALYGPQAASDPYRGLHISQDEVERLLAREPGAPILWADGEANEAADQINYATSRLAWLKQTFGLSSFDMDVILLRWHQNSICATSGCTPISRMMSRARGRA